MTTFRSRSKPRGMFQKHQQPSCRSVFGDPVCALQLELHLRLTSTCYSGQRFIELSAATCLFLQSVRGCTNGTGRCPSLLVSYSTAFDLEPSNSDASTTRAKLGVLRAFFGVSTPEASFPNPEFRVLHSTVNSVPLLQGLGW